MEKWYKRWKRNLLLYSGNRYEGEFKDDYGEGKGVFYYKNGENHEGQFHNGKPIGSHVKYLVDGTVEQVDY